SLFGIVNTLVLTVFERTREIGMLRAVGLTRWQTRSMIGNEAIVTSLIGAALGIVVGFFLAILVTHALSDEGVVFAVPYLSIVYFVIAAIIVGLLAAIWPARRAARLNALRALKYESALSRRGPGAGLARDRVAGPHHALPRTVRPPHDAQGLAALRPRDRAPAVVRLPLVDRGWPPVRDAVEAGLELPL